MYCQQHPAKTVTNICYEQNCLQPLCPDCISCHHLNHAGYPNLVSLDQLKPDYLNSLQLVLDRYSQNIKIQDNLFHIQKQQSSKLLNIIGRQQQKLLERMNDYFEALKQELVNTLDKQNEQFGLQMQKQHVEMNQSINRLKERINSVEQNGYKIVDYIQQEFKYSQRMEKERKKHLEKYSQMNQYIYEVCVTDNLDSIEQMVFSYTNVKVLGQSQAIQVQQMMNAIRQRRKMGQYCRSTIARKQQLSMQEDVVVVDDKQEVQNRPTNNVNKQSQYQQQWGSKKKEEQYQPVYQEDRFSLVYDSGFPEIDQSLNKAGFDQVQLQ